MEEVVSVRGLRRRYGDFLAVDGVDLAVRRGELVALLGTNGAGKTTTVETLEGHRRPDGGQVEVLGRDPYQHRRELAGEVGVMLQGRQRGVAKQAERYSDPDQEVQQGRQRGAAQQAERPGIRPAPAPGNDPDQEVQHDAGFAGELTVAETLRMWQRLHPDRPGWPDPLGEVELAHRQGVRVGQLSGGERRLLALALALATDPQVLVLDEPTTGLDPQSRTRTWEVLRGLIRRGRSILLTTHHMEEAEALAHRVAIMDHGRIVVSGSVAELVAAHPARIRCRLPEPFTRHQLPLLSAPAIVDGRELTVHTRRLQADLYQLVSWADSWGIALATLSATQASLGEVFAAMVRSGGTREAP